MNGFGSFGVRQEVADGTRLECGICWTVYDLPTATRCPRHAARRSRRCLPTEMRRTRNQVYGDRVIICDAVVAANEVNAVAWHKRLAKAPSAARIGCRRFNGTILDIMLTPVVIPAGETAREVAGSTLRVRLPAAAIDFSSGEVAEVGRIASCSLLSPVFAFTGVPSVLATAKAGLAELMLAADGEKTVHRSTPATIEIGRCFLRGVLTEPRT